MVCGDQQSKFDLTQFDYESFTGTGCLTQKTILVETIKWEELSNWSDAILVDVRPVEQFNIVRFVSHEKMVHLPLNDVLLRKKELIESLIKQQIQGFSGHEKLLVFCRSGVTSKVAVGILNDLGFNSVNVENGMAGFKNWSGKEFSTLM